MCQGFLQLSPDIILFLASLVDKAILLIFQAFIFQIKCIEKARFHGFSAQTNQSNEWFCAVGIKNSSAYGSLEFEVSAETSIWVFYAGLSHYIPAFFCGPITGYIGDHYSRKWALGIPTFGLMVCCIEMFFIANYAPEYYPLLLIGWFIFGVFGSIFIFIAAGYAIVAHSSEQSRLSGENVYITNPNVLNSDIKQLDGSGVYKSTRLAILQATIPFGSGFGVLISSQFIDYFGSAKTFAFVVIVSTIAFIFLLFCIEDIHPDSDINENETTVNSGENELSVYANVVKMPYKMMVDSYYISFCKPREIMHKYGREMLTLIILSLLSFTFCFFVHPLLDYLYFTLTPRNFSTTLFGIFSILQFTLAAAALVIILPPVVYLLRGFGSLKINTLVSCFGIIMYMIDLLIVAFSNTKLVIFLSLPFNMFHAWPFAGKRAIILDLVTTSEIGKVFAVVGSLTNLIVLAATFFFNWLLWPLALSPAVSFSGLPYVVTAVLLIVPFSTLLYEC